MQTEELDITKEELSKNGHSDFVEFDDDLAFVQHIISQKPAEKVVDVPEWNIRVLCRALGAEARLEIEAEAYDRETNTYDFKPVFYQIVMGGCCNPKTGKPAFKKEHRTALMREQDGRPVGILATEILTLSKMINPAIEIAKKN